MAQILQFPDMKAEPPIAALLERIYDAVLAISDGDHDMAEYVVSKMRIILSKMQFAASNKALVSDNVLNLIDVLRDNHNILIIEIMWMLVCFYQHDVDYVIPEIKDDLS